MLEAAEAMLTIEAGRPRASMPGMAARMVRYMEVTFRSKLNAQSSGAQSRIVPLCTKPAQLKRMSGANPPSNRAATAASERTSRWAV